MLSVINIAIPRLVVKCFFYFVFVDIAAPVCYNTLALAFAGVGECHTVAVASLF